MPERTGVAGLSIGLPERVAVFIQSIVTSRIPLNDANTEYAKASELVQAKITWLAMEKRKVMLEFFIGADNLLNQHYSLGNDINAFRGR